MTARYCDTMPTDPMSAIERISADVLRESIASVRTPEKQRDALCDEVARLRAKNAALVAAARDVADGVRLGDEVTPKEALDALRALVRGEA